MKRFIEFWGGRNKKDKLIALFYCVLILALVIIIWILRYNADWELA